MSTKKSVSNKTNAKGKEFRNYLPNTGPYSLEGIFNIPGVGGMAYGHMPPGGIGFGAGNGSMGGGGRISPLSEPMELIYNNSYYLLTLLRVVLTYAYTIHGPLRKVVNNPVYNAFRGGVKITTDEVSEEEKENLHRRMKKLKMVRAAINALRWSRLYGGAGIIINTNDEDPSAPFNINSINEKSLISFIDVDRWQLQWNGVPNTANATFRYVPGGYENENNVAFLSNIHSSRVARIVGEEAPGLIKQRLQGWGMSILEPIIRPIQLYFKWENAIFDYIDESKIDVMKIEGLNAKHLNAAAVGTLTLRIKVAMWMKNFMNAILMDAKDDYIQKQLSWSGLAPIIQEIRKNIAASCEMSEAELYGLSAQGFDSGESELELRNSVITNVREDAERAMELPIEVIMMSEWGFIPDDWAYQWEPLRVLSAEQMEIVKTAKFSRQNTLYTEGIYNAQEFCEALKEDDLLTIDTEVAKGAEPEPPMLSMMGDMDQDTPPAKPKKPASAGKPGKPQKD